MGFHHGRITEVVHFCCTLLAVAFMGVRQVVLRSDISETSLGHGKRRTFLFRARAIFVRDDRELTKRGDRLKVG